MDPQQEIEQLKRQLKSLKESSTVKERQLNEEVYFLKSDLACEKRDRERLQREFEELKLKKAAPSKKLGTPKKTIGELTDEKYQKQKIAKIEKEQLGPSFKIVPVDEKGCFGINKNKGMKFFLKVHLVLAFSDKKMPPAKIDNQAILKLLQAADEELVEEPNEEDDYVSV